MRTYRFSVIVFVLLLSMLLAACAPPTSTTGDEPGSQPGEQQPTDVEQQVVEVVALVFSVARVLLSETEQPAHQGPTQRADP